MVLAAQTQIGVIAFIIAWRFHVPAWFGWTLWWLAISWMVLSPRNVLRANFALKPAFNLRRVIVDVLLHLGMEYTLKPLSGFLGLPHKVRKLF